jgi:hypothetical protein
LPGDFTPDPRIPYLGTIMADPQANHLNNFELMNVCYRLKPRDRYRLKWSKIDYILFLSLPVCFGLISADTKGMNAELNGRGKPLWLE